VFFLRRWLLEGSGFSLLNLEKEDPQRARSGGFNRDNDKKRKCKDYGRVVESKKALEKKEKIQEA